MERKQFTFYRSFYDAVSHIRRKSVQADVYDAMCRYALNGEKPDLDNLPSEAALALTLIMPILESGIKKAEGAFKSTGKPLDTHWMSTGKPLDTHCKKEKKKEIKKEVKKEIKKENDSGAAAPEEAVGDIAHFEEFWSVYPKKVGKQAACKAFEQVTVPVEELIRAVKRQKQSEQWQREGGRFVPNPATWLNQQRWEDELPPAKGVPKGASGILGEAELESIKRMLKEEG